MLANRLKILLAERDLTIKDVMSAIGLTRPSVSNMVNNPFANVSTKNIDKLCNYLEITPAEFFDYSGWIFSFDFYDGDQPSVSVTMKSGKVVRTFQLLFTFNYLDSRDPHNNATDDFEIVTAKNPEGYDETFVSAYKELSPLFKHQVEGELVACAKKVLQVYDDSGNVPCVFNYDYKDDVVFEAKLN